jgi:hypothetical protein
VEGMETVRRCAWVVAILICGILIGYAFGYQRAQGAFFSSATREGGYEYVNPLLSCDISEDSAYPGFAGLQKSLQDKVESLIRDDKAERISVYFRDMNYAQWTGVNADDVYIPASLMKLPLYIAALKETEDNGELRAQVFSLKTSNANDKEFYRSPNSLSPGSYTIPQLTKAMIEASDNNAANTLSEIVVSSSTLADVYDQFGIPGADEQDETMSPKNYMRLFRILYNASYLWRTNSQNALADLSHTDFTRGLVAGIPPSTVVSHKFGERTLESADAKGNTLLVKRELHDCGVVYYPKSPYGICIMTEGDSFPDLVEAIAELSRVAYTAVDNGLLAKGQ